MCRVAKKNARRAERDAAPCRKICRGRRQDELRWLQKKTWVLAIRIIWRKFPPGGAPRIPGRGLFSAPLPVCLLRRTEKNFQLAGNFTWPPPAVFRGNVIVPLTRRPLRFLVQWRNNQERGSGKKHEEKGKRVEGGAGRRKLITLGRFEGEEGTRTGGEK